MKDLSSSTFLLTLGRSLSAVMGIVTIAVLARILSTEEYGAYQQVWLCYNALLPLLMLGVPATVSFYVPQLDKPRQKALILQSMGLLALSGLVASLIARLVSLGSASLLSGSLLPQLLGAFFLYPIFSYPTLILDTLFMSIRKPAAALFFTVLLAAAQFLFIVPPLLAGLPLTKAISLLTFSSFLCAAGALGYIVFLYRATPAAWNLRESLKQLRYASALCATSLAGQLTKQTDQIIIAARFSATQYAIYVNGARELPFVGLLPNAITTTLTPEFVRLLRSGDTNEVFRVWQSSFRKVAVLFVPLFALCSVTAEELVTILFSAKYVASAAVFNIYLLLLPLRTTTYGSILLASGRAGVVFRASVAALVLNVLLNLALIPIFGIRGAAAATVVSLYAVAGWQLYETGKVLGTRFRDLLPWRFFLVLFALSALPGGAALEAKAFAGTPLARLTVAAAVFCAAASVTFYGYRPARLELKGLLQALLRVMPLRAPRLRPAAAKQ